METFSASLAICAGNSPVPGEFPAQRPLTRNFDVFFDLHLNKLLSKQPWGWWFETPSCPLWRHRNEIIDLRGLQTTHHHRLKQWYSNFWQQSITRTSVGQDMFYQLKSVMYATLISLFCKSNHISATLSTMFRCMNLYKSHMMTYDGVSLTLWDLWGNHQSNLSLYIYIHL